MKADIYKHIGTRTDPWLGSSSGSSLRETINFIFINIA